MGKQYLFAMWEGGGNVPPLLGVARRLVARGHRVTVLGDPTIKDEAERFECCFLPWQRAPHRKTLRPEDDFLRDWETKSPFGPGFLPARSILGKARDAFFRRSCSRFSTGQRLD